eukprot:COSAG02_NODE_62549_length_265_cov_1.228916_1_plen_26_part_01
MCTVFISVFYILHTIPQCLCYRVGHL